MAAAQACLLQMELRLHSTSLTVSGGEKGATCKLQLLICVVWMFALIDICLSTMGQKSMYNAKQVARCDEKIITQLYNFPQLYGAFLCLSSHCFTVT